MEKLGQGPGLGMAPELTLARLAERFVGLIARQVIDRVEQLRGIYIPDDINVTVTRDYGATANEKAQT